MYVHLSLCRMQKHVEQFHMEVNGKHLQQCAFEQGIYPQTNPQISAAQWPKIQVYSCSRQLPQCAVYVCNLSSFWSSSIKKTGPHYRTRSEGKVEFIKLGGCSERCWSRPAVLLPSIASRSSAWMQRVAVRPLGHRADNTAPDGSVLWPVTPRSRGQSRVNRGQSLRTPHRVPLSFKGRVAL